MKETPKYRYKLLENVHESLPNPTESGKNYVVKGLYSYFHYECDFYRDIGWGCGYRTLQSMCSWIINAKSLDQTVPNLMEIQEILVNIGDKHEDFKGSRDWIGALEVFYTIDALFDVSCKIQHIPSNEDLKKYASLLKQYFDDYGGLVMMGGDLDCASKGIAGVHISGNDAYFLVLDPHFVGIANDCQELVRKGFVKWQHTSDFVDSSFYNLCMPQIKYKQPH